MFAEAFEAQPELANQIINEHRYYAACSAAQVGSGIGTDAKELSDDQRAQWREQARSWLRDDLAATRARVVGAQSAEVVELSRKLELWFMDPILACVRDDANVHKLPLEEQEGWLALWNDAKEPLEEARKGERPAEIK